MTPSEHETVAGGTSEATAIVTAAVTLMASCQPYATAEEIKQFLLDNADVYEHLKDKVKDGHVLNIWRAVQAFCPYDDGNDPYSSKATPNQDNTKIDL